MKQQKNYLRLTEWIYQSLRKLEVEHMETLHEQLEKFGHECADYPNEAHRYHLAIEKGLFRAAEKVRQRVGVNLNNFHHKAKELMHKFSIDEISIAPVSLIYVELVQIEQELGPLGYDLKERSLSVTTEPIVLDGIHLGPFEIRLEINDIPRLYKSPPYHVIALEPNPSGSDENVTHPHVSNDQLCEGDGYLSIRKALQEGRLCDFFMMIAQILNTYNPDSPYVSLGDWDGVSCYDCGYRVSSDESYYCESCNYDFCSECSSYCKICDTTLCRGCLSECPDCQEPVCKGCFGVCQGCERAVCEDCIDICVECNENFCINCLDENGICCACIENRKETEDEETIQTTTKQAVPAVQPDSVGQTRISA